MYDVSNMPYMRIRVFRALRRDRISVCWTIARRQIRVRGERRASLAVAVAAGPHEPEFGSRQGSGQYPLRGYARHGQGALPRLRYASSDRQNPLSIQCAGSCDRAWSKSANSFQPGSTALVCPGCAFLSEGSESISIFLPPRLEMIGFLNRPRRSRPARR